MSSPRIPARRRALVLSIALVSATVATTVAPLAVANAATRSSYTSFFGTSAYANAGWTTCPAPVTWTVDVKGMDTETARKEIRRVARAFATWSAASNVPVRYDGRQSLVFDTATNSLKPASGAAPRSRHVYIAFANSTTVPALSGSVVGIAMPTKVTNGNIDGGMAVFRRGYVLREAPVNPARVEALYVHELGHVMGLGHSPSDANTMYSTLGTRTALGPGDSLGVSTVTKACPS
jgi:hypothetical protein